jgi:DNA-binding IclR family transcriptional regulator
MLKILSWFSQDRPTGRIQDIARDLDLASMTVRRLLFALEDAGYVARDHGSGTYRLHIEVLRLASVAIATNDVVSAAAPVLVGLIGEIDETLVLSVLEGDGEIHLAIRQREGRLSIYPPIGRHYRAYEGGASGQVLLAWKDPEELDALLPASDSWPGFDSASTVSRGDYMTRLKSTRSLGYAINDGVTDPALWAAAAPIRDYTGAVVAAVSTLTLRSRISDARGVRIVELLVEGARKISASLLADAKPLRASAKTADG